MAKGRYRAVKIGRAAATMALVAVLTVFAGAATAKRIAFVVGVNAYDSLKPEQQLRKAVNDAHAVADTLKQIGFQVFYTENAKRRDFLRLWQHFLDAVEKGDTVAFYFAGHGFEIGGVKYLLLRDVPDIGEGEDVLKESSIQVDAIVERLTEQQPQVSLFIIDACRNDPFARRVTTRGIGGGMTRGFTRIEPPAGVLVMMSAGAGQEALDSLSPSDSNANSVYTRTLLPLLRQPGLEITAMAKQVRTRVEDLALRVHHNQRPAVYDNLSGEFYLVEANADAAAGAASAAPASLSSEAAEAWGAVKTTTNIALLDAYARRFSDSFYASVARARIDELKHAGAATANEPPGGALEEGLDVVWAATKNTKSAAVLRAFLKRHGDSVYAAEARARLAHLTQPLTAALTPFVAAPSTAPLEKPDIRRALPLTTAEESRVGIGDVFRECPECPEMVVVPGGSFQMGSPADEPGRQENEGPQHGVSLPQPFAAARFAVTNDQWESCVTRGGCPSLSDGAGRGRGSYPRIEVSFQEAQAYVQWLSTATGKRYRLLSEAEREYVARAGRTTPFWWGATINPRQANYDATVAFAGSTPAESRRKPLPVGFFQANPWGLYQVHGNVSEWVEDCFHPNYERAPRDGSAWIEPACARRVVRGGSWYDGAQRLRAASRAGFVPGFRDSSIGFRVARSLETPR